MKYLFLIVTILITSLANADSSPIQIINRIGAPLPKVDSRLSNRIIQITTIPLTQDEMILFEEAMRSVADQLQEEKISNLQSVNLFYTCAGEIIPSFRGTLSLGIHLHICIFPIHIWRERNFNGLMKQVCFIEELVHHFWNEENEEKTRRKVTEIVNKIKPDLGLKYEDIYDIKEGGLNIPKLKQLGSDYKKEVPGAVS